MHQVVDRNALRVLGKIGQLDHQTNPVFAGHISSSAWCEDDDCVDIVGSEYAVDDMVTDGTYLYIAFTNTLYPEEDTWAGVQKFDLSSGSAVMVGSWRTPSDTVDLIFVPRDENDAQFRVAFTVVDGVVETFRAGRVPMVLDADPCAT